MTPPSNQATITVSAKDVPEVRRLLDALMAEHRALHAYLLAVLLHDDTAALRHYELTGAHDAVADVLAATGTPMTDRTAPADPREAFNDPCPTCGVRFLRHNLDLGDAAPDHLFGGPRALAARQACPSCGEAVIAGAHWNDQAHRYDCGTSRVGDLRVDEPSHPHDGYAYDGCKCVCCTNVRVLAARQQEPHVDDIPGPHPESPDWHQGYRSGREAARQDEPSPALRSLLRDLSDRHEWMPGLGGPCICEPHVEAREWLAANPPQTREARLHHWDCRVPDDRPCPDVCVCWCHERFTADELLGDDNIFTEPPQTREAEGARYYDGGDDDAAKAQTGVLGMAAAAGDEAVRPGDGENDHGDRGVRGGDAADSARLTRQTPEAQRDAPADTIEAKIRALPSAMQSDPQERVVNRAAVIAAVEAAPADVERLAATLAKASDIAEWIATDIEDYQHGGREPDFAGWREAAIELCDLAAATQPPAAGTLDPDRCICGTDAALREGRTMILRTDVVCPKHDRPQPPAAGTEGGE